MIWQIPVFCRVLASYVLAPVLIKQITSGPTITLARKLVWQYRFSFLLSLVWLVSSSSSRSGFHLDGSAAVVLFIGLFNAFACYCQWRAVQISMSKTYMFTLADDLLAMFLGYIVLSEQRFLTPALAIGVLLALFAAGLFSVSHAKRRVMGDFSERSRARAPLYFWIACYSAVWGVAVFSMRYFGVSGMPLANYVFYWYSGSLVGSLLVKLVFARKETSAVPVPQIARIAGLSVAIWSSLGLGYWATMLAPLTVVQPIYQVAEMVLPVVIGLWIFKEAQSLGRIEKAAMAIGIVGGIIIAFGFR